MNAAPPVPAPSPEDVARLKKVKNDGTLKAPPKLEVKKAETDEKCPICNESLKNKGGNVVLVDGKTSYHTDCFVCKTCSCQFQDTYYPHEEKPYCLTHYCEAAGHTCWLCNSLIKTGTVMKALDRVWHLETCFRCPVCNKQHDSSTTFYSPDDQYPYCEGCVPDKCEGCKGLISLNQPATIALGNKYHNDCIKCTRCDAQCRDNMYKHAGAIHCEDCAKKAAGSNAAMVDAMGGEGGNRLSKADVGGAGEKCGVCQKDLAGQDIVRASPTEAYHKACFMCAKCQVQLAGEFWPQNGKIFCRKCRSEDAGDYCAKCSAAIVDQTIVKALGGKWHAKCLACESCGKQLGPEHDQLYEVNGKPFCQEHAKKA